MLNSFFNAGFKAAKCKTLLKLSIPRIKLLRNRRELQMKQMRKDIAKLLETGQEATARIRVEHIIREENMMAAQEIIELFCELITVRLPIIEAQRECPLDLKEAISTICFAAPRCADLPELLQVQLLFASKYGKEFVAAATELMPECGVNRQVVELLSVRAPSADKKLKLLKDIAEEHGLDWDPASSESELFKSHEDLLTGPGQFDSGLKVPLPKDQHEELMHSSSVQASDEHGDSDSVFDPLEFPEVPKVLLRPSSNGGSESEMNLAAPSAPRPELDHESAVHEHVENIPAPRPVLDQESAMHRAVENTSAPPPGLDHESAVQGYVENITHQPSVVPAQTAPAPKSDSPSSPLVSARGNEQFVRFISQPSPTPVLVPTIERNASPTSGTKRVASIDLQDVLAAAQAAALSAERAAAAARSAASLAQVRISELTQKMNDQNLDNSIENPFHVDHTDVSAATETPHFEHQHFVDDSDDILGPQNLHEHYEKDPVGYGSNVPAFFDLPKAEAEASPYGSNVPTFDSPNAEAEASPYGSYVPTFDSPKAEAEPSPFVEYVGKEEHTHGQPQRMDSMGDDPYLSYPNLFTSQNQFLRGNSFTDGSHSSH